MSYQVDRSRLRPVSDYSTWQERARIFVKRFGGWDCRSYISWITAGAREYKVQSGIPTSAPITDQDGFTEFLRGWTEK